MRHRKNVFVLASTSKFFLCYTCMPLQIQSIKCCTYSQIIVHNYLYSQEFALILYTVKNTSKLMWCKNYCSRMLVHSLLTSHLWLFPATI